VKPRVEKAILRQGERRWCVMPVIEDVPKEAIRILLKEVLDKEN
jgi:hypothetical protein